MIEIDRPISNSKLKKLLCLSAIEVFLIMDRILKEYPSMCQVFEPVFVGPHHIIENLCQMDGVRNIAIHFGRVTTGSHL